MDSDGSHRECLTATPFTHENPSYSHDGEHILFQASTRTIVTLDVKTRETKVVVRDALCPHCSPVEPKIAFVRSGSGIICTADLEGNNVVELREGGCPRWTHDGQMIVFADNVSGEDTPTQIFIMNADGTGRKQLTDEKFDCRNPAPY
jgi:Tol biopolymer transport system component